MMTTLPPPLPESIKALRIESGPSEVDKLYPDGGFKSFGHFTHTVILADGHHDRDAMDRLSRWRGVAAKAAHGLGIRLDELADWFVPVEFSSSVYSRMLESEYDLFSRVRRQTIRGNKAYVFAEDDANRDEVSSRVGGVTVHWVDEGDPIPPTEVERGRLMTFNLHKLAALVQVSDELIEDSEGRFEAGIGERVTRAMSWEIGRVTFEGAGGGLPLGAFNRGNPSLITVAKEAGQAADTLTRRNLHSMIRASSAPARAVWHCNTEVLEPLWDLNDRAPGSPILSPATAANAYANLLHRPLVPLEYSSALGGPNDITHADWDSYQVVFKGQTRRDVSMHARFIQGEASIRFAFRMDGKPLWNKPVTPYRGTQQRSPFLRLAERA